VNKDGYTLQQDKFLEIGMEINLVVVDDDDVIIPDAPIEIKFENILNNSYNIETNENGECKTSIFIPDNMSITVVAPIERLLPIQPLPTYLSTGNSQMIRLNTIDGNEILTNNDINIERINIIKLPIKYADLFILNEDPTNSQNLIINQSDSPGHSWMQIIYQSTRNSFGWGFVQGSGDPLSGQPLPGELYTNHTQGNMTSVYQKQIALSKLNEISSLWQDKVNRRLKYSYGGSAYDPNSTFCTEALIDVLCNSHVLNILEEQIITRAYAPWKLSFPSPPLPLHLVGASIKLENSTAPNPNEFEGRIAELNAARNRIQGNSTINNSP
jgi:hypothetical protein